MSFLMNDDGQPRHLATGTPLGGAPTMYRGLELRYFGPCAFARDQLVQRCATFRRVLGSDDAEALVDVDPLLLVAATTPDGLRETRLAARPGRAIGNDRRIFVTADGHHAVLVVAEGFVILPLDDPSAARTVRLRQLIHGMDVDGAMDLVAVGLFDGVAFYRISDGQHLGTCALGDGNVLAVALGGGRVAAVGESRRLRVLAAAQQRAPRGWEQLPLPPVRAGRNLAPEELDLSGDGALVALRRKRKDVLVVQLASGQQQLLKGHTDRVHLVRFVSAGQRLVTADKDNRVIIWPRAGERLITASRDPR